MARHFILGILIAVWACHARAGEAALNRLDSVMDNAAAISKAKETGIAALKLALRRARSDGERAKACHEVYGEYFAMQFDSAYKYADMELQTALSGGNRHYAAQGRIDKAELLAISGLYPEAVAQLDAVDTVGLGKPLRLMRAIAYYHVYLYWADYCSSTPFAQGHMEKACRYLRQARPLVDDDTEDADYLRGEYCANVENDRLRAMSFYRRATDATPRDRRGYAMASYAMAAYYRDTGDSARYEHFITEACISDIMSCTRESLAIQELAMHLFQKQGGDMERAERYINFAMSDAQLFNNRLRIIEISQKLPVIVGAYKQSVKSQNRRLRIAVGCTSLLAAILIMTLYMFKKQNSLLSAKRRELSDSNAQLSSLNAQLGTLNGRLLSTNRRREYLAKLYIDLCANFIDRLARFEMLVRRKIKAGQVKDLLTVASSARLSEDAADTFMHRFDKAFLDLYPSFVDEANALLRPGERFDLHGSGCLNPELRILALIRLGVKESSEIAALLFYTPRTIYNYRSTVKGKAICRDTFEADVSRLCTVI